MDRRDQEFCSDIRTRATIDANDDAIPRWPNGPLAARLNDRAGTPVAPIGPLVEKITPERASHLAERFGA